MLQLDKLEHPFAYSLEILTDDGPKVQTVDLIETFNYLLGLDVQRLEMWAYLITSPRFSEARRNMHNAWSSFSEEEKIVFLEMQRMFSEERFMRDRISLEKTQLRFYPGFFLVRALIEPHKVELANGKKVETIERMRSLFLYNPETSDLGRKIIPLRQFTNLIYFLNSHVGLQLGPDTVVDYVKFFGLTVQEEPFFFISSLDEIPWDPSVDPKDKERLLSAIRVFSPIDQSGKLDVRYKEGLTVLRERTFTITLPCISKHSCWSSTMTINQKTGWIRMDEDKELGESGIKSVRNPLPYYTISPTKEFSKHLRWAMMRPLIGFLLFFGLLSVITLISGLSMGVALVDVVFHFVSPAWSQRLNTWLLEHHSVMGVALACATILLLYHGAKVIGIEAAKILGKQTPGVAWAMIEDIKRQLQARFGSFTLRLKWIASRLVFGFIELVSLWGVVIFCTQGLFQLLYVKTRPGYLGDAVVFVVSGFLDTASFGQLDIVTQYASPYFANLTLLGTALVWTVKGSIGFLLLRSVRQFWQFSQRKDDE